MKEILQFNTTKERLKYLSGGFEEITPKVVSPKPVVVEIELEKKEDVDIDKVVAEATEKVVEEKKTEEKPKKKSPAKKKSSKKGKKDGEVQAE